MGGLFPQKFEGGSLGRFALDELISRQNEW